MPLDEGFINSVPEEIRNEQSFQEIAKTDPATFAKTYVESQKSLGRAIFLPDEKDPEDKRTEKLNSVYEKLGRPKAHTEYKKEEIFGNLKISDEQVERYQKAFHEAGLSPKQASRLVQEYQSELGGMVPLSQEDAAKALAESGWGDKVESNIGVAKVALAKFDEDGSLTKWLDDTGLGNHPALIRFMHKVGSQFKEDSTPNPGQTRGSDDKASAQTKLATIMNDTKHPYWNKTMNGHEEAIREVARLHEIIHGVEVIATVGKR